VSKHSAGKLRKCMWLSRGSPKLFFFSPVGQEYYMAKYRPTTSVRVSLLQWYFPNHKQHRSLPSLADIGFLVPVTSLITPELFYIKQLMWFAVHQNKRSLLCGMELGCIGNMCFIITLHKLSETTEICVQLESTIFQSCQLNQFHLFHGLRYHIFPQHYCLFTTSIQLHRGL